MRAILVSVDYSDLLALTLPYNRHHFEEVWVITSSKDYDTVQPIASVNSARTVVTDLFYANGAVFNKWAALEYGLDRMRREGWLCHLDADILWPRQLPPLDLRPGYLYSPLRRMFTDLESSQTPPMYERESEWKNYPIHRNVNEWAGYSQIYHASDAVLGKPPWHEIDWRHGGGADSYFQMKWPRDKKIRLPFEVLHLGNAGENWYGRVTPYLDGTMPAEVERKREMVREIWRGRRGKPLEERHKHEKLG